MDFRIADTFTASLQKLTAQEQKAVKTTAFDLQLDPKAPGLSFHKLDRAKDPNFWSVRVGADIRLIVHRTASSLLLVYADHHDAAYRWAERRRIERHPTTGAAQLVELREEVRPVAASPIPTAPARKPLFATVPEPTLLAYGVPPDWLSAVRAADEDGLFELADHLPQEAMEALLTFATGATPPLPMAGDAQADPFRHPDAERRFRLLTDAEELRQALDYPWARWAVFLHPDQRSLVERRFAGPARVTGSAGTGKTVVALHRAAALARRYAGARILLTTFSATLAQDLSVKLAELLGGKAEIADRVVVRAIHDVARDLFGSQRDHLRIMSGSDLHRRLDHLRDHLGLRFPIRFLEAEWTDVVDAWQIDNLELYLGVQRLGRKTRLGPKQRDQLWPLFDALRQDLAQAGLHTWPGVFASIAATWGQGAERPFDLAVVDEAQDIGVAELRFLAALAGDKPDGLFFAGDLGQRIFQPPFSWKALGIDVRGRSAALRVNYRTSHQIRLRADRLLPPAVTDLDGLSDSRRGTISLFEGPPPTVQTFANAAGEIRAVSAWLKRHLEDGLDPAEMAVFVRSEAELPRARDAAPETVRIGTMHEAKGLEFRAVVVMACDDDVLPLQARVEAITDQADLEDVYDTERHLLYVACTRARDALLVTGVAPGSEFLADLKV